MRSLTRLSEPTKRRMPSLFAPDATRDGKAGFLVSFERDEVEGWLVNSLRDYLAVRIA